MITNEIYSDDERIEFSVYIFLFEVLNSSLLFSFKFVRSNNFQPVTDQILSLVFLILQATRDVSHQIRSFYHLNNLGHTRSDFWTERSIYY